MKKLLIITTLLFLAGCQATEKAPPDEGKCEEYPRLCKEAPETLRRPELEEFVDKSFYEKALKRYYKYGHWDTYEFKRKAYLYKNSQGNCVAQSDDGKILDAQTCSTEGNPYERYFGGPNGDTYEIIKLSDGSVPPPFNL